MITKDEVQYLLKEMNYLVENGVISKEDAETTKKTLHAVYGKCWDCKWNDGVHHAICWDCGD